ncbi:MAG: 6-hydroxycyclohex-1-ene-1-carbonyl-CoA dehydrogenase [Xanthomonadales bacterium]
MSQTITRWEMRSGDEPLVETKVEAASLGEGEVLVEVAGCGVCHTDLGFYYDGVRIRHALPLTLGHEISGRVIGTAPGSDSWQDTAVIIPAVMPCGECDVCRRGVGNICAKQLMPGNDMHGGFASHIVVPSRALCRVDEQRLSAVGLKLADVSVLADAVTTPYQSAIQLDIQPGDLAIVVGVGGVGGYAVQIASAMGAKVVAIDVVQEKLEKLTGYGADLILNSREITGRDLKMAVKTFAQENGLRQTEWKIFECSGTGAGQSTAFSLLTFGARLAVVGFTMDKVEIRLSNLMAFHAQALGNWGCLPKYYPPALDMVLDGKISMKPFIRQFPLSQINQVFTAVHAHEIEQRPILVP